MCRSVLASFLGLFVCLSASAQTFLTYKNVAYDTISGVNEGLLSVDVYVPRGGRIELPVVMYVHGGGWQGGDRANVDSLAKAFTDSAWVFVSVNYRLSPACPPCDLTSDTAVRSPMHARDVAKAIAFVKARIGRYNGDGRRICLLGDEAGGHAVLLVCTNGEFLESQGVAASNIRAACTTRALLYEVPRTIAASTGDERSLFLNAFGSDSVEHLRASPADHLQQAHTYPPLLCYSGMGDVEVQRLRAFSDSCLKYNRTLATAAVPNIDSIRVFFRAAVPLAPLWVDDADVTSYAVRPNPAHDVLTIDGMVAGGKITLLDLVGRERRTIECNEGTVQFMLPSGLPSAVYLLRCERGSRVAIHPIVIE